MIERMMLDPKAIPAINTGAKIFQEIPLTTITPTIIAQSTNIVPKSFCNKIRPIGTTEMPAI